MAVSRADRETWARQVAALRLAEEHEDAQVTGAARAETVELVNVRRRAAGRPGLVNDEDEHPELGFHRLAVARGMVARRR